MIKIVRKRHGIHLIECWFAKQPIRERGIINYVESEFDPTQGHAMEFRTFISDLSQSEEEILSHFSKSCLYKVRRAPREGVTANFYSGEDLSDGKLIREFADFFEAFWRSKGVDYQEKERCIETLKDYAQARALAIGVAFVNDKPQVYHAYVMDKECARLLHSASQFRTEEDIPQTVVGFANRYLHKESMLYFKKLGLTTYDWGGAGLEEEVARITEFKESFGGTPRIYYNAEVIQGVLPKLVAKLSVMRHAKKE